MLKKRILCQQGKELCRDLAAADQLMVAEEELMMMMDEKQPELIDMDTDEDVVDDENELYAKQKADEQFQAAENSENEEKNEID